MIPVAALGQVREDPAQRGLAQPPHRLGGELQLARVALQVALPLQLALGLPERLHVVHGLAAQGAPDRGLVDVVEAGSGIVLAQLRLQVGQVSEIGQGTGGVAQAERLVAGHRVTRPGGLVHLRPPGPQRVGQPGHLRGQPGVLQRLLHQRGQLVTLPVGERAEQPLRGGGPADQRVHEFLEVARVLREHLAVAVHEAVEVRLGVLAPGVRLQHLVEIGQHVLDPLHGFGVRLLQDFLHAAELAVQDLAAEQVLEPLEGLPGGLAAPVVVGQPADGLRGVGRQPVQLVLAEPGLVAGVGEQLGPLLADRRVQQRPRFLQDAVQPATVADLALPVADPAQQVIQAAAAIHAAAQQIAQGAGRIRAVQHRVAQLVQGAAGVERCRQRIRPVVILAVPVTAAHVR